MTKDGSGTMMRQSERREQRGKGSARWFLAGALLASGLALPGAALAAESAAVTSPRVTATLLSGRDTVAPGERFHVGLVQKLAPHWHTYWLNPGDSGEPTQIHWTLPAGAKAGEIAWPRDPVSIPL